MNEIDMVINLIIVWPLFIIAVGVIFYTKINHDNTIYMDDKSDAKAAKMVNWFRSKDFLIYNLKLGLMILACGVFFFIACLYLIQDQVNQEYCYLIQRVELISMSMVVFGVDWGMYYQIQYILKKESR